MGKHPDLRIPLPTFHIGDTEKKHGKLTLQTGKIAYEGPADRYGDKVQEDITPPFFWKR